MGSLAGYGEAFLLFNISIFVTPKRPCDNEFKYFFRSLFSRHNTVKEIKSSTEPEFPPGLYYREFFDQLYITKLYCDRQLKNNPDISITVLRSINPILNGKNSFDIVYSSYPEIKWQTDPCQGNFLEKIFYEQLTVKENIIQNLDGAENIQGKILMADFDYSVFDGASAAESADFVDTDDIPAIDTWIYLNKLPDGKRRLYAWVPKQFIEPVNQAIAVNVTDCLRWYDGKSFRS